MNTNTATPAEGRVRHELLDAGKISAIELDRPAKRNAMSLEMSTALRDQLLRADIDDSHVVLLRSAVPGIFCAGLDISYLGTHRVEEAEAAMMSCCTTLQAMRKVTIAYADGSVFGGGCELFLSADLRLATPDARFRITPAVLGVVYPFRGLARLIRYTGITAAMEMILTARVIDAQEAMRIGLVTRVVADTAQAEDYSRETANLAPLAQQAMKAAMKLMADRIAALEATEAQWHALQAMQAAVDGSEDQREGRAAFREKRSPNFRGR